MKKLFKLLILFIVLLILIYFIFTNFVLKKEEIIKKYCNNVACIYTKYSLEDVKEIPIINQTNREELKSYNISLVFIDPDASGNFSVVLINLLLYLSRQSKVYLVCKYYKPGCIIYTNSSIDRYIWIFQNNQSFIIDTNKVLLLFIEESNKPGIEIYKNNIYLYGNESTIIKVLDKFLFYWYGFTDN